MMIISMKNTFIYSLKLATKYAFEHIAIKAYTPRTTKIFKISFDTLFWFCV